MAFSVLAIHHLSPNSLPEDQSALGGVNTQRPRTRGWEMQAGAFTQDHLISSLAPIPKACGSSAGQSAAPHSWPLPFSKHPQEFLEGPDASFPGSYLQRLLSLPLQPLGLVPLWFPSARSRGVCPTWTLNFEGSYWNVAHHWG